MKRDCSDEICAISARKETTTKTPSSIEWNTVYKTFLTMRVVMRVLHVAVCCVFVVCCVCLSVHVRFGVLFVYASVCCACAFCACFMRVCVVRCMCVCVVCCVCL